MNKLLYFILLAGIGFSCGNKSDNGSSYPNAKSIDTTNLVLNTEQVKDGLKIYPLSESPAYKDSRLILKRPQAAAKLETGRVEFGFQMQGNSFVLGNKTQDANKKQLANFDKGQYIQLIVNKEDGGKYNKPVFQKEFEPGHYVVLAYLSRSYHESVKHSAAKQIFQFTVGDAEAKNENLAAPQLFYSQPSGTYSGDDAKKVLLDFYLLHTNLAPQKDRVLVTVNGDTEFEIAKWQPYILEGLPMGENTVKIELINWNGDLIGGDENSIERTFIIEGAAQ